MEPMQEIVDRYFAVWNETDPARRRHLIAQTWTEEGSYVDPLMTGDGHAGINVMIEAVQTRYPGHRFRQAGDLDTHHDRVRFNWEIGPANSPPMAGGLDVGIIVDGRFRAITGFLDFAPATQGQ